MNVRVKRSGVRSRQVGSAFHLSREQYGRYLFADHAGPGRLAGMTSMRVLVRDLRAGLVTMLAPVYLKMEA